MTESLQTLNGTDRTTTIMCDGKYFDAYDTTMMYSKEKMSAANACANLREKWCDLHRMSRSRMKSPSVLATLFIIVILVLYLHTVGHRMSDRTKG
jgi:hypothetical protein